MTRKHAQAHGGLLLGGQVNKPQDPGVWPAMQEDQRPEVLVQRHQHPALPVCLVHYFVIARVFVPVSSPQDIVTSGR